MALNPTIIDLRDKLKCLVDECTFDDNCGCLAEISAAFDAKDAEIKQLGTACDEAWKALAWIKNYDSDDGILQDAMAAIERARKNHPTIEPKRPGEKIIEATREIAQRHLK